MIVPALQVAAAMKKTLDTAALKRKVADIEEAVASLDRQLAEDHLAALRAGYRHLADAVDATQPDVQRDELTAARRHFVFLAGRDASRDVRGTSGSLSGGAVAALSHVGNFHCFILRDEHRLALLEAYRCAEAFPVMAAQLLPADLFSRDYGSLLDRRRATAERAWTTLGEARDEHRSKRARYYGGYAWAATKALGVAAIGVVAVGMGSPTGAMSAAMTAKNIIGDAVEESGDRPTAPDEAEVARADREHREILASLVAEAATRRSALEESGGLVRWLQRGPSHWRHRGRPG